MEITLALAAVFALFIVLSWQLSALHKEVRLRLTMQDAEIGRLARQLGLPPEEPLLVAVRDALRRGKKVEAVKLYHDAHGGSLNQAKDAVDRIAAGHAGADMRDQTVPPIHD